MSDRRTYDNLADDRGVQDSVSYSKKELNRISEFGLYAISQLGNSINIDGDIQMFLGQSSKLKDLLSSSYRELGIGGITLKEAKESLNAALKGDYIYPGDEENAGSSPLQNGLNVESPTFKDSQFNTLSPAFDESNITVFAQIGESHGVHSSHSHSGAHDLQKGFAENPRTRSVECRIGGAQNDAFNRHDQIKHLMPLAVLVISAVWGAKR